MLLSQSLAQEDGNIMIWLMVLNEYRIVSLDQDWWKTSLNYFCQRNNKYQNLLLLLSLLLPKECSVELFGLRPKLRNEKDYYSQQRGSITFTDVSGHRKIDNKLYFHFHSCFRNFFILVRVVVALKFYTGHGVGIQYNLRWDTCTSQGVPHIHTFI